MSRLILLAIIAQTGGDRYYSTEQYATRNGDTPANVLFEGRITASIYERAVAYPVWNRDGGEQAASYIDLINTDGGLDSWLAEDWRDVRITLKTVEARAAYSTALQVGVCVVDRLEAPDKGTVRFVCRSALSRLEKVITSSYSTSITNENMRGKPKPITLGRVRWMDPSNPTLNNSAGAARGMYDVADGVFEDISGVLLRGAAQSEVTTPQVNAGSQHYFIHQQASAGYGFLMREQFGYRLVAEVRGQIRRGTQALTRNTFATAIGWDQTEAGASTVDFISAGIFDLSGVNDTCQLTQTMTTVSGQMYQLEVVIDQTTDDGLDIIAGGTTLRTVNGVTSYTVQAVFTASGTLTDVGVEIPASRTATARVNEISCYPVTRIATLAEVVRFAAVTRGSLSTSDLALTALAAVDTAAGYEIGWHSWGSEVRGVDLVEVAAQSFGVAIFQNASGELAPVRIAAPAGSAAFSLDELSILEISYEADTAPGLSTRMEYGRNYAPHSQEDLAGLPESTTTTIALLKAELQREALIVTTTETLDTIYSDATEREPLPSLLSEQADAQAEIDRICALYTVPRAFYSLRAFVESGTTHTIEPGNTVAVTHSRYSLTAGKNLLVVAARSDFVGNAVDLVLWG